MAAHAGADGITAHLREDRRHIREDDIARLSEELKIPLNLEMAATDEMVQLAVKYRPHATCIVPEQRKELTTEGGLDVLGARERLEAVIQKLSGVGCRVSLFIEPDEEQLDAAKSVGAPVVELHTGIYCEVQGADRVVELERLKKGAAYAQKIGLECHAGHGINFETVSAIAEIPEIVELNIGHFLIGEAIYLGIEDAVHRMRDLMNKARASS
tara:strand:- start:267 stop:905 length:639 start_codon:yes stop_codon:yes gene_type:complete